jgi:hypothetical protein
MDYGKPERGMERGVAFHGMGTSRGGISAKARVNLFGSSLLLRSVNLFG